MVLGRNALFGRVSAILLGIALIGSTGFSGTGTASISQAAAAAALDPLAWPHGVVILTQASDESTIQQVGESDNGDVEDLDENALPVASPAGGTTTSSLEDIELLDQRAPQVAAPAVAEAPVYASAPVDSATASAPADYGHTSTTAPVHSTGFWLPEGFGSGNVQVSTGRGAFPSGLGDCHVGAVTGRAYVGISCGEDSSFVGHAPSFQDFPFVTDADFPFDSDSRLLTEGNFPFDENDIVSIKGTNPGDEGGSDDGADNVTVVSAGTRDVGSRDGDVASTDAGNGMVERTQRSSEREPRVRVSNGNGTKSGGVKSSKKSKASSESSNGKDESAKSKQNAKTEKKSGSKAKSEQKKQKAKHSKTSKKRDKRRNSRKR